MEAFLGVITGIGLSAACGFRIFVPLLVMNLAIRNGFLHIAPGFEWIGSEVATIAFSIATALEIIAYYTPWLDNLLDTIASPVSIIAGTIAAASVVTDLSPSFRWILAIIAGGGTAGIMQGITTVLRVKSSLATGGIGNVVVASIELAGSLITAVLAIIIPAICFIIVVALCAFIIHKVGYHFFRKSEN
ncbi:MAG: DUF4126 domain-containing protein [Proteobacteria bacterium]|nr:DUF4126 domain-containing protein [Pseudomonadota bacterium]